MLVIICCTAICLQLPYTVIYLLNKDKLSLWPEQHGRSTLYANIYLSMKVADVLATANYALNFALYCVSGSAFRDGVRRLCRPRRHQQQQQQQSGGGRLDGAGTTAITDNYSGVSRGPSPSRF